MGGFALHECPRCLLLRPFSGTSNPRTICGCVLLILNKGTDIFVRLIVELLNMVTFSIFPSHSRTPAKQIQ